VGAVLAPAVILATGGIGQVFRSSTNPAGATGDGIAAALRAGAVLGDLEFVQFHPTVLWLGTGAKGQVPLISEAVRGEGALLLDVDGHRFMPAVHEMAELAPRDVVAHAIVRQMAATGADNVLLDARHLGREFLRTRFPTINARLLEAGIDWSEEPVPVAPAQHYHSGGVVTDLDGRSSVDGLYAVGEVACTGVHGANRLASNSLLEGLVFASRAARDVAARFDAGELEPGEPAERPGGSGLVAAAARSRIQKVTSAGSGVIRSAGSLAEVDERLTAVRSDAHLAAEVVAEPQAAEWETTNVYQVARALTRAAALREETRGGHYRTDFPKPDDAWKRRIQVWLDDAGVLTVR
jgi:L-aspartate oxidase